MGCKPDEVAVLIWIGSAVPGAAVGAGNATGTGMGAQALLRMRIVRIIAMRRGIACLGIGIITLIIIRIICTEIRGLHYEGII
jgi:hypothetical protein